MCGPQHEFYITRYRTMTCIVYFTRSGICTVQHLFMARLQNEGHKGNLYLSWIGCGGQFRVLYIPTLDTCSHSNYY